MPGARSIVRPAPASESSVSDEACQLELHLQRQLEEDIASDVYTECNIKYQEKEIIKYLENHLNAVKSFPKNSQSFKTDVEDADVFLTPKCGTPYIDKSLRKSLSTSPSTDLTKEYYALVPIEGTLLEKELIEQDALSNAFETIIKSQTVDLCKIKLLQHNKPTSLSLTSSHIISNSVKHSNSCDILNNLLKDNNSSQNSKCVDKIVNTSIRYNLKSNISILTNDCSENDKKSESIGNKGVDPAFSPDSLITDDPSSSSDYLSAAYNSPGASTTCGIPQLNVEDTITRMENTFTSSDSGLENTGLLESLSSHKDITLTDVSLTECTLHDLVADEANDSVSGSLAEKNTSLRLRMASQSSESGTPSEKDLNVKKTDQSPKLKDIIGNNSSKEEKQRQNEEIVILESSSLSSETGSWESVFPPKAAEQSICERLFPDESGKVKKNKTPSDFAERNNTSLIQKSPFKSTSCFIDAASLVDEEEDTIEVQTITNVRSDALPAPSQPLPCTTAKFDVSPNDWSESNDNEDSLEQADNKDSDSVQKDLSPTIFEMTPITEDSLCTNAFENEINAEKRQQKVAETEETACFMSSEKEPSLPSSAIFVSDTPHNSIMSLKVSALKQYESEESENDSTVIGQSHTNIRKTIMKYNESSPIVSGGASIEDHLPQMTGHSGSPLSTRKIENMPIVSGAAYITPVVENNQRKLPKLTNASAWIVDMAHSPNTDIEKISSSIINSDVKRPGDRTSEILRNGSKSSLDSSHSLEYNKSRSSVDSNGSEKSSHKFYIDLSSFPDPISPKNNELDKASEKKNIFSMFIELEEKPAKEMPARLSSTLTTRKNCAETKKSEMTTSSADNAFEKYESLCNDPNISISEIIKKLEKPSSKVASISKNQSLTDFPQEKTQQNLVIVPEKHNNRNVKTTIKEESVSEQSNDLFVKLSDLDKPLLKPGTSAAIKEEKVLDVRMTRSIPENTWGDQNNPGTSRSIEVISSFHSENALSLNRLFPHLKNEFSRSMPGSLSGRTRSPMRMGASSGDFEEQEMSEISSVQSSMCPSVIENSTTEDTSQTSSLIGNCQSRLGQDLLRMFLQEIAPDVIVEVSGRRIKAHKCILSSRCQYFAGILSGGWVESAGNVIILPPFSYNVVHFALCHIYSGLSTIPDTISIVELATIADMLGLEGLKEAIMFTLKAKYCHHFHRPCQVCTAGVLECFPLSSVYGLDDLYRKCLKWITKYFSKVWPTKAFATLPKELLDICYQQHIVNLSIDNLFDTVYGCGITVSSLQNSRWADSVSRMCQRLVNSTAHFAAARLTAVMRAAALLPPDAPPPAHDALLDCLSAAIEWAQPEEACRSYAFLSALVKEIRIQHYSKPDLISNGNTNKPSVQNSLLHSHAGNWRIQCEGALVRNAPRVVGTQAFNDLPPELRKRLRELGCIMYGAQSSPFVQTTPCQDRKSKSTYTAKSKPQNTSVTHSLDIDHVRASLVPYSAKPAINLGVLKSNNDIRDVKDRKIKGSNPPKIRTTKAQEERARYNLSKNNQSQDRLSTKIGPARIPFENTKPRYLEPRMPKEVERKTAVGKKLVPKMISSSESSRNSSPIQLRNARKSRMKSRLESAPAISQDSLATHSRPRTAEPSTDSLSESQNIYATYTKNKHTKGSTINPLQCTNILQTSNLNNKTKTKIPVYLKKGKSAATSSTGSLAVRDRPTADRKVPGSLMNATKSSSAKIVPKVIKETVPNKSKRTGHNKHDKPSDIPVMERSGTFLKDEPTFGDKTTNIDIDLDH